MRNRIFNFQFSIFNSRGFTLLELLVVIAIIGVLSSLLMVNFIAVRERSRDAQRKSNLRQVQSALELYRADVGSYPSAVPNCVSENSLRKDSSDCANSTIYMKKIPTDPSGNGYYNSGAYYYSASGTGYSLVACLENTNDTDSNIQASPPTGAPTNCSTSKYYVLTDL